jgi:hypothetical protein
MSKSSGILEIILVAIIGYIAYILLKAGTLGESLKKVAATVGPETMKVEDGKTTELSETYEEDVEKETARIVREQGIAEEKAAKKAHAEVVAKAREDLTYLPTAEEERYYYKPPAKEHVGQPPIPETGIIPQVTTTGINWLEGKCETFGYNILNIVKLTAQKNLYWLIPNPQYRRYKEAAGQIKAIMPNSGCKAERNDVHSFLINSADTTYSDNRDMQEALYGIAVYF